jgi:beta-glucuronidase
MTGWRYLADPGDVGVRDDWPHGGAAQQSWDPVSMPNDFNPVVSDAEYTGRVGWYKVTFPGPAVSSGRSWDVRFEEVRRVADVWLNGVHLGRNTDAYAPFSLPATSLYPDRPNTMVVRVDNRRGPGSFPEDWWNWGGIVRPVALVPVGRLKLIGIGVMPELGCRLACGDLLVEATVQNLDKMPQAPAIVVRTRSPSGVSLSFKHAVATVQPGASLRIAFKVPVHGPPELWAPGHPALYKVQLSTMGGARVEQIDSLGVGMRSIAVRHGVLYLNGSRLWLHGASIHEDMPGRGAALTDGDIYTIVAELRTVGANITRAHYLLSDRLLSALDAAGILVWSQAPVDHADPVLRTAAGRVQALSLLRATILWGRSHPSVVIDSVGNELTPTPDASPGTHAYVEQAIPLARTLDPAAVVALDTYCYPGFPAQTVNSQVDVLGISSYFGWYTGLPGHPITDFAQLAPFMQLSHARYPNQALVVAEFGAEGRYDGAATIKGTYEFQSDYVAKTFGALDQLPFMNGAIYWTLREFAVSPGWIGGAQLPPGDPPDGLHHKGLIAYDGTDKPAYAVAQQQFGQVPGYAR